MKKGVDISGKGVSLCFIDMNDISNLSPNKLIRNLIVLCDVVIVLVVMMLVMNYGSPFTSVWRPLRFMLAGIVSILLAQVWFSTLLHQHYESIDRVLPRASLLVLTFGMWMTAFCGFHNWILGQMCNTKAVFVVVVLTYIILLISRLIEAMLIKEGRKRGRNKRALCFVGDANSLEVIAKEIDRNSTAGLWLVGYFAPEESESLSAIMPYRGGYEQLDRAIAENKKLADDMYCSLPPTEIGLSRNLVKYCMEQVIHFYYVPVFMNEFGDYLKPSMIGGQVVFANFNEPLLNPSNRLVKRLFDIVCSGLALVVLLPFLPIVAVIIKVQSPGPIFFKQSRTGLGGKDFMMLKFRSMHVNRDADKVQCTKNDPRKYPFGNFMRKSSVDELPQLWNIFVGDMSIVGPRPHMRAHTEEYRKLIDYYMMRHYIRPGLTGWAQTNGFRGETKELWQMEGRVKRDIWYIQNWSFWLDIRIIFRTAWQIVKKDEQAY